MGVPAQIKRYIETRLGSYVAPVALDTDSTLAANSDARVASQKAVKTALALKANGTAGVLRYNAIIAQAASGAPTATVLENTLGGTPVWGRTSAGLYTLTLAGVWTSAKTQVFLGAGKTGTPTTGGQIVAWERTSVDVLTFYGFDVAGAAADWLASFLSVQIVVYP
jgi:hypothetical protein